MLNTNTLPKTCSSNGGQRFTKSLGILSKYFGCKAGKVSVHGKWWLIKKKFREKYIALIFRCIHAILLYTQFMT